MGAGAGSRAADPMEHTLPQSSLHIWSRWRDSNPRPSLYESAAHPPELHRHSLDVLCQRVCPFGPSKVTRRLRPRHLQTWSRRQASNPQPPAYKAGAHPVELRRHGWGARNRTLTQRFKASCPAFRRLPNMAGRQGFEPRPTGSEPAVLPLDDLPISCAASRACDGSDHTQHHTSRSHAGASVAPRSAVRA